MIYSRGPRPKALVSDVLCKISGILNHFNQFKSLGGPQGLRDIFIEYIEKLWCLMFYAKLQAY